ncbi:hypothetical protein COR50_10855 [Chitinophaga caeni]|uniref:Uncharacterized protein n=1 Tax=Chitinophaga caeni TaxID=2029983 RepID=A0A291QUV0_9BACT|nr:tetratricopeptide repeat protein [Chitinophaga caeni]ATL47624.1 hypothetical protein COR50_10855 [Chitinophaga caeni]
MKIPSLIISLFIIIQNPGRAQIPNNIPLEHSFRDTLEDAHFLAMKDSLSSAMENKQPVAAGEYLREMGRVCFHMGHYPQALDYLLQAAKICEAAGAHRLLAEVLNDMGTLYYYTRQPLIARDRYDQALTIYKKLNDPNGMAYTFGVIGHLYEKQQRYDSAFFFQDKALQYYGLDQNEAGMAKIYENLGSIHEDLEHFDSAYHYFKKSLDLGLLHGDTLSSIETYNNLGDILRKTGQYRAGLTMTQKALDIALAKNEGYQVSSAYRDLAKAYHLLGKDDSAFILLEQARSQLLDIYSQDGGKQLAFLQTMFDIGKKNTEIEQLRNTRKSILFFIIGGILIVLLATVIISRQRLRIKHTALLRQQEQQRYRSQTDLLQLKEESLKQELEVRSKVLNTHTLHIIQKNQLLEDIHGKIHEMIKDERRDQKKQLKQLQQLIHHNFNHDQHWEEFRGIFEQIHESFFDKLKLHCDHLTANDLRLIALLKMNMSSTDIATLLGISPDSLRVLRYRLRKKLQLQQGENLVLFIQSL